MPTIKQLELMWQADKVLGYNEKNDYGRNLPYRPLPEFTGPSLGTIEYDDETGHFKIIPNSTPEKSDL